MAYCHECGEEIAEIDTFCPFCGISLQPIMEPSEDDQSIEDSTVEDSSEFSDSAEEKLDETIAINGGDLSNLLGADNPLEQEVEVTSKAEPAIELIDEPISEPENENEQLVSDEDETLIVTDEDTTSAKDVSVEPKYPPQPHEYVPEEKLLFTARSLNTPTPKKETVDEGEIKVEKIVDEVKEKTEQSEIDSSGLQLPLDDKKSEQTITDSVSSKTESSMMSYEESEIREKPTVQETTPDEDATIPESEKEMNLSATIPYIPQTSEKIEAQQKTQEDVFESPEETEIDDDENKSESSVTTLEMPETPDLLKEQFPKPDVPEQKEVEKLESVPVELPPEENEIEDSSELISDEPIAPPAEELKEPEPESAPIYDSVSIRATDDEDLEDDNNSFSDDITKDYQNADQLDEAVGNNKSKPEDSPGPGKIRESKTTPNIGDQTTDGKKSQLKPLDEGTLLNERYEIIRKIGGGGMGAVYLASDKNLGGVLRAVKEMVQSYIEEEQQDKAINDFKRESLLLTSLEHPAIPTIYDYFYDEKEGRFYLVMKYINGGDLASRLNSSNQGRIDEETVTDWAIQIADVLNYLHNRQPPIVYRDLKPANIMIDGNTGRVMLIDFGIARWINKEEKGVTAVGTMGYAPPELFSGNVESSSDIYSLGSTMFHLLTGADPQSNPLLIFDFQKNPKPREINPHLSDQMETILMKMVEYNADKRFSSSIELKQVLEEHLRNLQSGKISYGVKETPAGASLTDEKVFCGFCGQKIVASDMFCAFCGAKQPIASKGVHGENYTSAPLTARLVIMGTNELEPPAYKIEKDNNLVGRRDPMSNIFPEVDLSKFDPQTKISRRHARIWREGSKFMVEDLGSSNGTFLMPVTSDSTRLMPNQPHILTNGDKLKLGDTTLHFVLG